MESSEYATDRGTTWRSTALALPENVQRQADRNAASDFQFVTRALPRFRSSGLLGGFYEPKWICERRR